VAVLPEPAVPEHGLCRDLTTLLIRSEPSAGRLPGGHRSMSIEGRTRGDVAATWTAGRTVGSRLARARENLAGRLARAGVVSVVAVAAAVHDRVPRCAPYLCLPLFKPRAGPSGQGGA